MPSSEPTVSFGVEPGIFCLTCGGWPQANHPSPPDYSDHKFVVIQRVYITMTGYPLWCFTCKRRVKGLGGHQDHVVQQLLDVADAEGIVAAIDQTVREGFQSIESEAS